MRTSTTPVAPLRKERTRKIRRWLRWLVCLALVAGCGGGAGRGVVTRPRHGVPPPSGTLGGHPQVGVLRLQAGRSSAHFKITALSPPHHTYNVQIIAPAATDLAVRIRTWYGVDLGVTDSTTKEKDKLCKASANRIVCNYLFPELEAQRAGPWTVIATKHSRPPATVRIAVTFFGPR
jgi:hypothetical protein